MIKTKFKNRCVNETAFKMEFLRVTRTQKPDDINSYKRNKALGQKLTDASSGWMLKVRPNQNSGTG